MVEALNKNTAFTPRRGPVVLAILDGVGFGKYADGDAVKMARTPVLDGLMNNAPCTSLKAHGTAVGMPSDADMGNSEVGAKLVEEAVVSGKLFEGETWKEAVAQVQKNDSVLHFIGLFSDGNVHSNISHLKGMVENAAKAGVKKVLIPHDNAKDIQELDKEVRNNVEIVLCSVLDDVFSNAFEEEKKTKTNVLENLKNSPSIDIPQKTNHITRSV